MARGPSSIRESVWIVAFAFLANSASLKPTAIRALPKSAPIRVLMVAGPLSARPGSESGFGLGLRFTGMATTVTRMALWSNRLGKTFYVICP